MRIQTTKLAGVLLIEPQTFPDERGIFLETYQRSRYRTAGILDEFVQDNQSRSRRNVLRGLHYQVRRPQAQLLTVLRGSIFDVVVDLRRNADTFGHWLGVELGDDGPRQIYMGPGFAHGFCVLSELADLHYKVTREYDSHDEGGILWSDQQIGIQWPIGNPVVSARDAAFPVLQSVSPDMLPHV